MFEQLHDLSARFEEITSMLSDPEIAADPDRFRSLAKEHARLEALVTTFARFNEAADEIEESRELLGDDDPELRRLARDEIAALEAERETLQATLLELLIPPDPLDERDIFLEIRAGAGGDEAALFAADMLRMYTRYAQLRGWRVEPVSENSTGHGGYREVVVRVTGDDVYSRLKHESGTHRVQRVPVTESKGRIHTSTITVAIMPEALDVDVSIDEKDLRVEVFRASGAGGQHVNKTSSAVRVTHLPTDTVIVCQDERSQAHNRARAMQVLRARLLDAELESQRAQIASDRREQVGTGDRSERIRTYNFPQSRVTDHRIQLTLHSLPKVMEGELDVVIDPLLAHHRALALKAQGIGAS